MTDAKILLARLDRIPVWTYPYSILLITGIGFLFSFFDIVTIGFAIPVVTKQFNVSTTTAVWTITTGLIGYIIGSILDSRISDLFGRRLALLLSVSFFSVGSLLCALSPNIFILMLARFITGMGIGAEIPNAMTYIGELSPPRLRGYYSCIAGMMAFIGFALVPFVAMVLVPNFEWGWRWLFLIGGLGGTIIFFMRRGMPHSIHWLIAEGRLPEAEQFLIQAEQRAVQKTGQALKDYVLATETITTDKKLITLLKSPYVYRVILFALLWFFYYVGNYGWLTLSTELFDLKGLHLSNSIFVVAISSLGFILGGILAVFLSDKVERKWATISVAFLWSLDLLIIGWLPLNSIWLMLCGFIASTTVAFLVTLMYTYTAEHFPTSGRASGVSLTDGFGHLGGAFCGQIILGAFALFKTSGFGFQAAFTAMALSGFITMFLLFFGKKLNGKVLT